MYRAFVLPLALVALILLAACSAGQEAAPAATAVAGESSVAASGDSEAMASDETASNEIAASEEMTSDEMASDEMMAEDMASEDASQAEPSDQAMDGEMAGESEKMDGAMEEPAMEMDRPAWQTMSLTNARTGETFTLADFAGKTVFVEPMATWCTNCRRQLGNVKDAYAQLAGEDVVFVALSVETTIGDGTLANYANEAGFDWLFAVLTPEMLQALASEFGQTIANPPSTPHFVIRPDGSATELVTGIEPAEQIVAQIQAAQG